MSVIFSAGALIRIAYNRPELQFKNGEPNQSAIAEAVGVSASSINRIFNGKRNTAERKSRFDPPPPEYQPSPALLEGIRKLIGGRDQADALKFILKPALRAVPKRRSLH